jgi:type IV pilus assembly protein PilA
VIVEPMRRVKFLINRAKETQMSRLQKGFTLIELMIVVAIIGILAAVAIPAYQDYTARAQVAEAVELLTGVKTPLGEFFADKGRWPNDASLGELVGNICAAGTTCRYTQSLTQSGGGGTGTVLVTAAMKPANVASMVQSKTVTISSADGKLWTCQRGDIDNKYLPAACK